MKAFDETGNRYGRLIVISRADNKKSQTAWLCSCKCGNQVIVAAATLRNGQTQSCGCLRKEGNANRFTRNEIGNRYGRLVVVSKADRKGSRVEWQCHCDCGNEVIVRAQSLRSGNTKSCGCIDRERKTLPNGVAAFNSLYNSYRLSAKRRNYEWSLTKEQVHELTTQPCYYCGTNPMQSYQGRNGNYIYNGIDRIDSKMGYVPLNTVSCCLHCNYAKREMTSVEFANWVTTVYNHWVSK